LALFIGKISCHDETMAKGKTTLQEFTRTMTALFRVPKSEVEDKPKPRKKPAKKPN
jgi:hypothetical protein